MSNSSEGGVTDAGDSLPTRASLLFRLCDLGDSESWRAFFETYWRLIYNVARKTGLSDDAAQDLVQETVIAIARKMPEFRYDPATRCARPWSGNWRTQRHLEPPCAPPTVPDPTLLRRIGSGAYGEVWLARSTLGTLRAVKVVCRARFKEDRPYEREFNGILKYEPLSRTHEGLVQVLHVGRGEGCFYYVMELADAAEQVGKWEREKAGGGAASSVSPARFPTFPTADYTPRTLRSEFTRRPRLPPTESAQLVFRLAGALAHLHTRERVHRDIKPGNVIFVGGQPKVADIGLVTEVGSSQSFVGTEGFIPPEGPGTPQADLYGLGKLLYELATGRDRMDFPQLPPGVPNLPDGEALLELNEIMTRACAPEPQQRYASATEMQAELNLFLAGRSLRQSRNVERNLMRLKKFTFIACIFLVLAAVALWFSKREERHARERASNETTLRQRAESAEHESQRQLHTAVLEQARATVRSGEAGHRVRTMDRYVPRRLRRMLQGREEGRGKGRDTPITAGRTSGWRAVGCCHWLWHRSGHGQS